MGCRLWGHTESDTTEVTLTVTVTVIFGTAKKKKSEVVFYVKVKEKGRRKIEIFLNAVAHSKFVSRPFPCIIFMSQHSPSFSCRLPVACFFG